MIFFITGFFQSARLQSKSLSSLPASSSVSFNGICFTFIRLSACFTNMSLLSLKNSFTNLLILFLTAAFPVFFRIETAIFRVDRVFLCIRSIKLSVSEYRVHLLPRKSPFFSRSFLVKVEAIFQAIKEWRVETIPP